MRWFRRRNDTKRARETILREATERFRGDHLKLIRAKPDERPTMLAAMLEYYTDPSLTDVIAFNAEMMRTVLEYSVALSARVEEIQDREEQNMGRLALDLLFDILTRQRNEDVFEAQNTAHWEPRARLIEDLLKRHWSAPRIAVLFPDTAREAVDAIKAVPVKPASRAS